MGSPIHAHTGKFRPQTDQRLDEVMQLHMKGYSECGSYF